MNISHRASIKHWCDTLKTLIFKYCLLFWLSKLRNTTGRKCLDCLSRDVMMKSVHKYKRFMMQIYIFL